MNITKRPLKSLKSLKRGLKGSLTRNLTRSKEFDKDKELEKDLENELEKEILFQDDDATKNSDMLDNNESSKDNPSNAGQEHNLRYRGHGNTVTPL